MRLLSCVAFVLAALTGWALDPALVGRWKSGAGAGGEFMEIQADGSAVLGGSTLQVQADRGKMKFVHQPGVVVDATYTINGSTLVITMLGENETWQRVAGAPAASQPTPTAPPAGGNPLTRTGNPLAAARPAAPAAGSWSDGNLTLTLREAGDQLLGELVFGGQKYPTTAPNTGTAISGAFESGGAPYMYAAKISGDAMEFQSGGQTYVLKRRGAAPAGGAGANPLGAGATAGATAPEAAAAPGNWLHRSDDGFDLLLPGDFRVLGERGGGILLGSNVTPGLMIVFSSPEGTAADLERALREGVQVEGISMSPRGGVRDVQVPGCAGKLIDVAGTMQQTAVQGLLGAYLRSSGKGGLAILAATTPESWPKLQPFAEQAVHSVKFYQPTVSDRLLQARQALSGHSLVTSFNNSTTSQNSSGYYTGSSVSSFRAWHCCASGRCRYEGARSSSFQGGGVIGASDSGAGPRDGSWELQAQGNDYLLVFRFDGGGSASWTVSVDTNGNVFVDGTRVKVTTDSICDQL